MIKKIIYILIVFIISANISFAQTQNAAIEKSIWGYRFKPEDAQIFLIKANESMRQWENSLAKVKKDYYLQEAMKYYTLLEKAKAGSIEAEIGLGRVYDELKMDIIAKKHFFNAYNLNPDSPKMNYYFGNYYYKRHDLLNALSYYKKAYGSNSMNTYEFYYKMGNLYEKLADIETANKFYTKAYALNPKDSFLRNKIYKLEKINYSSSQYYIYQK